MDKTLALRYSFDLYSLRSMEVMLLQHDLSVSEKKHYMPR